MGKPKKAHMSAHPAPVTTARRKQPHVHRQMLDMQIVVYLCDGLQLSHKGECGLTGATARGILEKSCSVKEADHKGPQSRIPFM